jgi:hypothetical protein
MKRQDVKAELADLCQLYATINHYAAQSFTLQSLCAFCIVWKQLLCILLVLLVNVVFSNILLCKSNIMIRNDDSIWKKEPHLKQGN